MKAVGAPKTISNAGFNIILAAGLAVTGGISAVVFAFPSLVLIGLYLLVIPGLILGSMPTLFVYLLVFSLVWFTISRRNRGLAIVAGLVAVVWFAVGLPVILNQQTAMYDIEAGAFDHAPSSKISTADTVVLQSADASHALPRCGPLCQILLYNGVAKRVIVPHNNLAKSTIPATSYRIERQSSCPDAVKISAEDDSWIMGMRSYSAAVRVRIASGECLVAAPEWNTSGDLLIRRLDRTIGWKNGLVLRPSGVQVRVLELEAGGQVTARGSQRIVRYLRVPLHLEPVGSMQSFTGWEWSRKGESYRQFDTIAELRRLTDFNLEVPRGADPKILRERIDAALDDQTLGPKTAALALVQDYFTSIVLQEAWPGDTRRIVRLIADPRLTRLWSVPVHKMKHDADRLIILDAILDRLRQLAANENWEGFRALAGVLEGMPKGAFSRPDPRVDNLVADIDCRRLAPGLIKRLADRGPAAAGTLASVVLDSYSAPPSKGKRHPGERGSEYAAALDGLCLLGSDASPVLPRLREAAASGAIPAPALESDHWRCALIAMGAHADEFGLPKGHKGPVEQYRSRLEKLAHNQCKGI